MATTNYSWNLPVVGGSEDTWGTQLNANWTALDTLLGGTNATEFAILDGATVTTAELNKLDGVTATTAELNILDGVTATTAEINTLDGFTGTVADLNYAKDLRATGVTTAEFDKLDGLTATTVELNKLDGATASTAELNILAGATVTTAELNILDGVTATTAEINKLDGVTWTLTSYNALTATAAELNTLDGISGIASQAEAEAGTSSTKLMTPQRTNQAILALGFGTDQQAWSNVTASRSTGTTYTNTTGRAIIVNIETNTASAGSADTTICTATVGGVSFVFAYFRQDDENYTATSRVAGNFVVPAGATYSVAISGNTVNTWHELR